MNRCRKWAISFSFGGRYQNLCGTRVGDIFEKMWGSDMLRSCLLPCSPSYMLSIKLGKITTNWPTRLKKHIFVSRQSFVPFPTRNSSQNVLSNKNIFDFWKKFKWIAIHLTCLTRTINPIRCRWIRPQFTVVPCRADVCCVGHVWILTIIPCRALGTLWNLKK